MIQKFPISKSPKLWRQIFCLSALFACFNLSADNAENWPQRPVKVIVPFGAGGSSDTFTRQLIRVIKKDNLLSQPLVVINVGGAGGTIGSRRVRNARPDGYTMLMLHEGILTAKHAGKAAYGPEAFEAVAATGMSPNVIAVKSDSHFESLKDLMAEAKKSPNALNFAANIGAPSHFAGLILEKTDKGAMFNFVQYGGGAERYGAIMGGHVDMSVFSIDEYLRYKDGGLKALAVFSNERQAALPELPTSAEQGFELNSSIMNFWWMPKGTPEAIRNKMAEVIEKAMASQDMQGFMKSNWIKDTTLKGQDLSAELVEREKTISEVSMRKIDVLPRFERWIFGFVAFFSVLAFLQKSNSRSSERIWNFTSIKVFALSAIYVSILSLTSLSYPLVSSAYVFVLGLIITRKEKPAYLPLAFFSLVLSFGLFFLFTRVLVVDLPG
ncbi:tripartite tricarboxylate transporter substrate-binding protein [Lentisphaera marina]|uniref:tripartite tricarboxylate transporter substrate binding protein n=1 Tax=Lentisphaera marina TaxID=1111041 RepID=UPI0023651C14|nr:tripartite tricarboxylate transporter substrate-binding protein [Lentisphaera marina]MDD7985030.1 tripartite tricarboxylate transporter substrate-binding protein [Lentisphaera marina]